MAVTAFDEGGICCREDSDLFYLAAIFRGDEFVILSMNACGVPLLRERTLPQAAQCVPTRCPLYCGAESAVGWLRTALTVEAALSSVRRLEVAVRQGSPSVQRLIALTAKVEAAKARARRHCLKARVCARATVRTLLARLLVRAQLCAPGFK